ncbi:YCF48-related protein [Marinilabilia sp.]|uniref:YCF48-related protein n=1 Tax=Marinilabilia sp. TaxID=2021252 RepID=UPI0025BFA7B8|nr:YCF48-related protein [Marinilabilia sp.]
MKQFTLITFLFVLMCLSLKGQTHIHPFVSVSTFHETENGYVFAGETREYGSELWVTDGSAKGTFLLSDIFPGHTGSHPEYFLEYKGKVYFSANHPKFGKELWVTDGTSDGTTLFMDIQNNDEAYKTSSNASPLFTFQDGFIFKADRQANSPYKNIWYSDGTEIGSKILVSDEYEPANIFPHNDSIYISRSNVFKQAHFGTKTEHLFNNQMNFFRTFPEGMFFATYTTYQSEIWLWFRESNTGKLTELKKFTAGTYSSQEIDNVTKVGNKVFFSVRSDPNSGEEKDELWVCDINTLETKLVKSFSWERHWSGSYISNFREVNKKLCFSGPSTFNHNLWISDGTEDGTFELGEEGIFNEAGLYTDVNNENVYYFASGNWGEKYVYKSDGTKIGTTTLLKSRFNVDEHSKICGLINNYLFFLAEKDGVSSLWSSRPAAELRTSKTDINFWDVNVDSMAVRKLRIYNEGGSMLALSEVEVVGEAFYLNDTVPDFIGPGEEISLNVIFFPVEKGLHKGTLRIKSNDTHPLIEIGLGGDAIGDYKSEFSVNADSILRKILLLQSDNFFIGLDNDKIEEGNVPGTLVGNFVVNNSSVTYSDFQMVAGDGDTDNDEFSIVDNQLFADVSFDFESHTTKLIRIKCVSSDKEVHEQNLKIKITDEQEAIVTGDCQTYFEKLTYGLFDVALNETNGLFAVGEQGHLIRSVDFGHTWSDVALDYTGNLREIVFSSEDVGYILTDYDYLLKTENGGEQWFLIELPSVDDFRWLESFYFINENIGFVSDSDGYLYKTVDGGKSWSYKSHNFDGFSCFYFFNENKGIAFRGNTYYTTGDGGDTWNKDTSASFASGTRIRSVSFTDDQNGYLIDREGQIYRTLDQGKTWFKSYKLPEDYGQKIIFRNKNVGYAFGGWFRGKLFQTIDGGESWIQINSLNFDETINGIAFNDEGSICIVGSSGFGSTQAEGRTISVSEDEGESWEKTCNIVHDDFFGNVLFPTEQTGYVTSRNLLFKTSDGGITWNELPTKEEFAEMNVVPLNMDTLVAYNNEKLIRSFDGGLSWQASESIPDGYTGSRYFNQNGSFFYVIQNKIVYSNNFGDDWQVANTNVSDYKVSSIDFKNSKLGYAFGDDWLKTTDGGENWIQTNGPEGYSYRRICFASDQVIYAGGMNGLLSKTEDGGQTWERLQTGHSRIITDILFFDESEGYYTTDGGVFYTSDGGENWLDYGRYNVNSIYSTRGGTLYLACDDAQVIRLNRGDAPLFPGYFSGNNHVCINEPQEYAISTLAGTQVQWILPENTLNEVYGNKVVIVFPESGVYELSASLINNCGISSSKTITIEAGAENLLTIDGKINVKEGETELPYMLDEHSHSRYSWSVDLGKADFQDGNSIEVTWGTAGTGQVKVFEINTRNQCRSYASLGVNIESKTGIKEDWAEQFSVYPNPVRSILSINLPSKIGKNSSLELSSLSGNVLWHKKLDGFAETITLNVHDLSSGVYLLKICSSERICVTKKIIVSD